MLGPSALNQYIRETGANAKLILVDVETPTVEMAAQAVGAAPANIVKSLIFIADDQPILVIAGGNQRVSLDMLGREIGVDPESIRLAKPQEVIDETGYPVGAVPPFGHRQRLTAYMDVGLLEADAVYAGGGASDHLVQVSPQEILRLSGANVIKIQS
jgi:prolyl-tRNA editing enzyme YbaK/EbsC (Cys-tRNA(Pro) deacylase)